MSGNPTLDAANASTGVDPLNEAPDGPQLPNHHSSGLEIPDTLKSLPTGCEAVVLPLSDPKSNNYQNNASKLPNSSDFENLIKSQIRPPGPSRAEEMSMSDWTSQGGEQYAGLLETVREASGGGEVKVYKVEVGVGKEEFYVAGLDVEEERILAVRITATK